MTDYFNMNWRRCQFDFAHENITVEQNKTQHRRALRKATCTHFKIYDNDLEDAGPGILNPDLVSILP